MKSRAIKLAFTLPAQDAPKRPELQGTWANPVPKGAATGPARKMNKSHYHAGDGDPSCGCFRKGAHDASQCLSRGESD
jgi:hypothetical protein